jgi:predicted nucleic acid-binding protein
MAAGPVILDTDTLSELSRGNLPVHRRTLAYLETFGRITTTSITVFERLRGYELAIREGKPFAPQRKAFELLVATCVVLPFDRDASAVAGRIWSAVSRSRRRAVGDILIAAIAVSRRLPLVTRNRADFESLVAFSGLDLELVDWSR